jgi:hypothetical protein
LTALLPPPPTPITLMIEDELAGKSNLNEFSMLVDMGLALVISIFRQMRITAF